MAFFKLAGTETSGTASKAATATTPRNLEHRVAKTAIALRSDQKDDSFEEF